jgi:hypothetical protein
MVSPKICHVLKASLTKSKLLEERLIKLLIAVRIRKRPVVKRELQVRK